MTHTETIKPCPFCGKEAKAWKQGFVRIKMASCRDDGCTGYYQRTTFNEWNRRPIEDTLTKRVAELDEALKIVKCELWDLPSIVHHGRALYRTRLESITAYIEQALKKGESDE